MAAPHEPDAPTATDVPDTVDFPAEPGEHLDEGPPPVLRLRLSPLDIICTVVLIGALVVLATATSWPAKLYGFTSDICPQDTCEPVPFGVNYYIYPVMWGGIGAALAACGVGPFVSLLKGWFMSFWPAIAVLILVVTSFVAHALTAFSAQYWH
ncbi:MULTISPECIES: hypothetical protein [Mycobacterium]|uniref:Uncharacterized protein n=1 Tax=Mycobacterium kiyosense TaxID=2871094 RepID=A0A9P3Q3N4_9MYCO|nr:MULTISPECIES: hypothetical protein [Mycobacterium]BDB42932.1 hypothetical protein IWGMT90018_33780 [Mycobacterium kiyosense]BDE13840.1 hypothetical protein MKCMC460_27000 [Mycobacterium sp. 20KCMC460]GLB84180.1 hypothetical protein SRL2020028_34360 [Mycobacterium kiyosense]GLB90838.1 hypothetical protein SRL2020130_36550 [Mycobacterium kiyosense]GLB94478.1 hypothetical protein SRL2020226_12540 [Mycobacterium kiyosense]